MDLFADRHDLVVFEDLVTHAIKFFGSDVASVECATSLREIETILRKRGFLRVRMLAPTVVASCQGLIDDITKLRNEWFFSKADHDWDQIHLG